MVDHDDRRGVDEGQWSTEATPSLGKSSAALTNGSAAAPAGAWASETPGDPSEELSGGRRPPRGADPAAPWGRCKHCDTPLPRPPKARGRRPEYCPPEHGPGGQVVKDCQAEAHAAGRSPAAAAVKEPLAALRAVLTGLAADARDRAAREIAAADRIDQIIATVVDRNTILEQQAAQAQADARQADAARRRAEQGQDAAQVAADAAADARHRAEERALAAEEIARAARDTAQVQAEARQATETAAQAAAEHAQQHLDAAHDRLRAADETLQQTRSELQNALDESRQAHDRTRAELDQQTGRLTETRARLTATGQELTTAQDELTRLRTALASAEQAVQTATTRAEDAEGLLAQERDAAAQALTAAQQERDAAREVQLTQTVRLQTQLEAAVAERDAARIDAAAHLERALRAEQTQPTRSESTQDAGPASS
ncbi:hypothetical protein [Actinomadura macra]|uniref:hypothetical protein n=1 Tax=Actinomadura macra TaxID=46164 RepID=UPI000AA5BCD3|nr:hypothetical protein [Actinomadura macra]